MFQNEFLPWQTHLKPCQSNFLPFLPFFFALYCSCAAEFINDFSRAMKCRIIGMNIISMVKQTVEQADHKPGPEDLTSQWGETLMLAKQEEISVRGFAMVAGKERVRIPLNSLTVVCVTGWRGPLAKGITALSGGLAPCSS